MTENVLISAVNGVSRGLNSVSNKLADVDWFEAATLSLIPVYGVLTIYSAISEYNHDERVLNDLSTKPTIQFTSVADCTQKTGESILHCAQSGAAAGNLAYRSGYLYRDFPSLESCEDEGAYSDCKKVSDAVMTIVGFVPVTSPASYSPRMSAWEAVVGDLETARPLYLKNDGRTLVDHRAQPVVSQFTTHFSEP